MPPLDAPFPARLAESELAAYWLPFSANRAFKRRPRLIDRAEGMHYYTPDGRELIDAMSGLWCCNAGHCREPVVEAIRRQAGRLDYAPAFQTAHAPAFALASRLAKLAPGDLNHVFFCNSGSEAVDTALKIALAYHKLAGQSTRTRFISRERSYHGSCLGGTSLGGIPQNRNLFEPLLDVDLLRSTYSRERQAYARGEPAWGGDLADDLSTFLALDGASHIAALIVEPMTGSAGVFASPQGYLQRLREITRAHGILLIFDEVITGFGRLGHAFAAERYGVVPDMITFAKGVTSGAAPLGGVLVREHIHEAFMQGPEHVPELAHGFTYSGHPLGVAAANAALDLYRDEGLFERARSLEPVFADAVHGLKGFPRVVDIRSIGLAAGIDLAPIDGAPGLRGARALDAAFFDEDLVIRVVGDTLVLAPALVVSEALIAAIVGKVAHFLQGLR
ncbi:MAG TPA: aspartate aminotransferase family protein [Rhizobiales bacterium]|jgi:beta-alanine--pyruvate transaminase|nr:aspartate aminotransferase family protein [Hyphomicrobiales bacterium]HBH40451.1 aspartate aminotransferase family protein [Hyphomicrobiales bacterium]